MKKCKPILSSIVCQFFFFGPLRLWGFLCSKFFFEKIREFPQEGIKKAARKLTSVRLFPPDALKSCVVLQFRTLNFLSPRKGLGRTFDLNSITLIRCFSKTPPKMLFLSFPKPVIWTLASSWNYLKDHFSMSDTSSDVASGAGVLFQGPGELSDWPPEGELWRKGQRYPIL